MCAISLLTRAITWSRLPEGPVESGSRKFSRFFCISFFLFQGMDGNLPMLKPNVPPSHVLPSRMVRNCSSVIVVRISLFFVFDPKSPDEPGNRTPTNITTTSPHFITSKWALLPNRLRCAEISVKVTRLAGLVKYLFI